MPTVSFAAVQTDFCHVEPIRSLTNDVFRTGVFDFKKFVFSIFVCIFVYSVIFFVFLLFKNIVSGGKGGWLNLPLKLGRVSFEDIWRGFYH